MGLRELNAERTRELILDAAIDLFVEQGYDETTLEHVAERAGVSISTLYRYFPTKDLLVLAPVALHGQAAQALSERPADEPLDVALGHAVVALLTAPRGNPARLEQVVGLVATSPSLSARLRDEFVRERVALQKALARRLGRPEDDVYCGMTARVAMGTFELAGIHSRTMTDAFATPTFVSAAEHVMAALAEEPPTMPRWTSEA